MPGVCSVPGMSPLTPAGGRFSKKKNGGYQLTPMRFPVVENCSSKVIVFSDVRISRDFVKFSTLSHPFPR